MPFSTTRSVIVGETIGSSLPSSVRPLAVMDSIPSVKLAKEEEINAGLVRVGWQRRWSAFETSDSFVLVIISLCGLLELAACQLRRASFGFLVDIRLEKSRFLVFWTRLAVSKEVADAAWHVRTIEIHGKWLRRFCQCGLDFGRFSTISATSRLLWSSGGRTLRRRFAAIDELERLAELDGVLREALKVLTQVVVRELYVRVESRLEWRRTNRR